MKIGIFCAATGFGGSQNTTASMALELARRGHEVELFVDKTRFRTFEDISSLEFIDLPRRSFSSPVWGYFSIRNAVHAVREIQKNRCEVMLCVGPGHIPTAMLISALFKIPCVYYALYPFMQLESRLFSFSGFTVANSEETRDSLAKSLEKSPECIPVVRSRINLDMFALKATGIDIGPSNVRMSAVMMARLEHGKSEGVLLVMESIHKLNKMGKRISLDVIGNGKDISRIQAEADRINADLGTTVISLRGPVYSVQNELRKYNIALGIGRCAWEAMACGKPTVVVGREGLGGIVCPENLAQLMRYNFTARGNQKKPDAKEVADALETLIDNADYRRRLGDYALQVIRKYYDVKIGAQQLEQIMRNSCLITFEQCPRLGPSLLVGLIILKIYHVTKCLARWVLNPYDSVYTLRSVRFQTELS